MITKIQNLLLQKLWHSYIDSIPEFGNIFRAMPQIDHLAMIDLPSSNSGIPYLYKIFNHLGLEKRGEGYLPDKQNNFMWLGPSNLDKQAANAAFPQIIIADYNLEALSPKVRKIVDK